MLCPASAMAPPLITSASLWSHPPARRSSAARSATIGAGWLTPGIAASVADRFHALLWRSQELGSSG